MANNFPCQVRRRPMKTPNSRRHMNWTACLRPNIWSNNYDNLRSRRCHRKITPEKIIRPVLDLEFRHTHSYPLSSCFRVENFQLRSRTRLPYKFPNIFWWNLRKLKSKDESKQNNKGVPGSSGPYSRVLFRFAHLARILLSIKQLLRAP